MRISNVRVYDLEESIIASGFPMTAGFDADEYAWQTENLKYWLAHDMLEIKKVLDRKDDSPENWIGENGDGCFVCGKTPARKIKRFNNHRLCVSHRAQFLRHGCIKALTRTSPNKIYLDNSGEFAWLVLRDQNENSVAEAKISCEDILKVCNIKFGLNIDGYAHAYPRIWLHKIVCAAKIVDHINRNKLDCRRENLRSATANQNQWNSVTKVGSGKITGVYRSGKSWAAHIYLNNKRIWLGNYQNEDDAIVARLKAEVKYYQEFAPQNDIAKKYGVVNPYIVDENKRKYNLGHALKHFDRLCKLAAAPSASGHCNALTGCLVSFNVTATNVWMLQAERYHFLQIISSMSKMHRLKQIVSLGLIPNVCQDTSNFMRELLADYERGKITEEQFIYECPMGLELTCRITTNYLQLKTVYNQRKNHKLKEWRDFCAWIETLPFANQLITLKNEEN